MAVRPYNRQDAYLQYGNTTMPSYDFHCNHCGRDLTLFYKTYRQYDEATPTCTTCDSNDLTRVIGNVNIGRGTASHDYTKMNAEQMLGVFESGDSRAVGEMMKQVGASVPGDVTGENYHNAAEALSSGKSMDAVERDLRNHNLGKSAEQVKAEKPAKPDTKSTGADT